MSELDTIALIAQAALKQHAPFAEASVPVLLEQVVKTGTDDPEAQIGNDVAAALAAMGCFVQVRQVQITGNKAEGALLYLVGQLEVACMENPSLNTTGLSQSALATETLKRLAGFSMPGHIAGVLNAGSIVTETNEGGVTHVAVFELPVALDVVAKVNPVLISIDSETGEITLSCATEGAVIYYLVLDEDAPGDYPDSGDETYAEPFTVQAGQVVYAAAWKSGLMPSDVASAKITTNPVPTLSDLSAGSATASTMVVTWTSTIPGYVDGYQIQAKLTSGSWDSPVVDTTATSESTTLEGLASGVFPAGNESWDLRVRPVGGSVWQTLTAKFTAPALIVEDVAFTWGLAQSQLTFPDFTTESRPTITAEIVVNGNAQSIDAYGHFDTVNLINGAHNVIIFTLSNAQVGTTVNVEFDLPD